MENIHTDDRVQRVKITYFKEYSVTSLIPSRCRKLIKVKELTMVIFVNWVRFIIRPSK